MTKPKTTNDYLFLLQREILSKKYCRIFEVIYRISTKQIKQACNRHIKAESKLYVFGTGDYFGVNHVLFSRVGLTPSARIRQLTS